MSTNKQTTIQVTGLNLNSNPHIVPPGSLQVADNVLSRKAGALQPLGYPTPLTGPNAIGHPVRMFCDWLPKYFAAIESSSGHTYGSVLRFSDSNTLYDTLECAVPGFIFRSLQFDPTETQATYTRTRHIFTEHTAPIVVENLTETTHGLPRMAGLPPPIGMHSFVPSSGREILGPLAFFAYKVVFQRILPSYGLTSAPSPVFIHQNTNGASFRGVALNVMLQGTFEPLQVGDRVVVYRTTQQLTVAALGEDFRQVASYPLTLNDIQTQLFVTIIDNTDDDFRGIPLYTNAGQEGAGQLNLMPPPSTDVAVYADTAFYRSKNSWPAVTLSIPGLFGRVAGMPAADQPNAIGQRVFTGTRTIGSAIITGVASISTGIVVGQMLDASVTSFPADTRITSITGAGPYTFNMSAVATSSGTTSLTLNDTITIAAVKDGVVTQDIFPFLVYNSFADFEERLARGPAAGGVLGGMRLIVNAYCDPVKVSGNDYCRGVSITVWSPIAGLWDRFAITVTNGQNYSDPNSLDVATSTARFVSIQDTMTNRLFFSKTSEPEHVGSVNFIDVGRETILRMVPTQSSLLVFCTDGLYSVSGTSDPWTVTQIDRTAALMHTDAAGSQDGNVFAWLADGLNLCSEQGVQNVSQAAVDPLVRSWTQQFNAGALTTFGPTVVGDDLNNEVWLSISYYDPEDTGTQLFIGSLILNTNTGAFTTQSIIEPVAQCYCPYRLELVTAGRTLEFPSDPLYTSPDPGVWADATVLFNPISSGDLGVLKQWVDVNLFLENVKMNEGVTVAAMQFLFSDTDTAGSLNIRNIMPENANKIHCLVPRRVSVREKLIVGFKTFLDVLGAASYNSVFFDFYGFTARMRVASETLKR